MSARHVTRSRACASPGRRPGTALTRFLHIKLVLLGLVLCAASMPTAYALVVVATTGTSSGWNLGGGGPAYFAQVFGNFNNAGFVGPRNGPAAFKGSAASTSNTGRLNGPAGSGAFVQNVVTSAGTLGVFRASNTYTMTTSANTGNLPVTAARGRYIDPYELEILSPGLVVTGQQGLLTGSQVQARDPRLSAGASLPLVLQGRFGEGDFAASDPAAFWPDSGPPPAGAFDLYNISIFENSSGAIDATVQLFASPDPDYSLSFSATASQIENAIRNANWVRAGDIYTMQSSLSDLLDVTITRLTSVSSPIDVAIGYRGEATTTLPAPEPPTLALFSTAAIGLLGWRRKRRGERPSE